MIHGLHVLTLSMLFALFVPRQRLWIAAAVSLAFIAEATATPVEMRFWSAVGVPSITSLALLASASLARFGLPFFPSADRALLLGMAAAGFVAVNSSALGFLPLDLYRYGFSPLAPMIIAVVAAILLARQQPAAACVVVAALAAFDLRLLGSGNLWDYFVDPIVGIVAIVWLARTAYARLRVRPQWPEYQS